MSEASDEKTTGGLAGKVVGKAKELAGELTDNDELAREGRLQQAQGEAGVEAREEQRDAQLAEHAADIQEETTQTKAERERVEGELEATQIEQHAAVEREKTEDQATDQAAAEIKAAEAERERKLEQADDLERQAARAETTETRD